MKLIKAALSFSLLLIASSSFSSSQEHHQQNKKCISTNACLRGCALTILVGSCVLMQNNIQTHSTPPTKGPFSFIHNYQPRFYGLGNAQEMTQEHCPQFLLAAPEKQKMIDIAPACSELTDLEKRSNQHHVTMLTQLASTFTPHYDKYYDEYNNVVNRLLREHKYNLEQIAQAKEKCGCKEDKKKK